MERVRKLTEPKGDGVVMQKSRGFTIQPLPASTEFSATSCIRCEGLLVREWTYDLQNPGNHQVESFRCVQCGNRIDPVILQNQFRVARAHESKRQVRHANPLREVA
jgi:hypothetical protein